MNHQAFVKGKKTMLVAPAGHGKTHTIAECLKHTDGRQLILTHTHAGVASIKDKISRSNIKPAKYRITTISSFAQKYSHAFYTCLLYTSPSPRDLSTSRMPSAA